MKEAQAGSSIHDLLRRSRDERKQALKANNVGDVSEYPESLGNWVFVETLPKPNKGERYPKTPLSKLISSDDRFGAFSFAEVEDWIRAHEENILSATGLTKDQAEVRLLPAVSYNLFANRFGWGATESNEWVGTRGIDKSSGREFGFAMGHRAHGGAGAMVRRNTHERSPDTGFRLAIYLKSEVPLADDSKKENDKRA